MSAFFQYSYICHRIPGADPCLMGLQLSMYSYICLWGGSNISLLLQRFRRDFDQVHYRLYFKIVTFWMCLPPIFFMYFAMHCILSLDKLTSLFDAGSRHRVSFCIFCSLPVPDSSVKPMQRKSSMTFIHSNRCIEIDIIILKIAAVYMAAV